MDNVVILTVVLELCCLGGLYPAPQIPAGGIIFGRGPSQICHSGGNLFRRNRAIPELTPECSPECTGMECNRNPVPKTNHIKCILIIIISILLILLKYVTNVTNPTISDYNLADNNNMYIYSLSGMLLGLFGRREGAFLDITTDFMSPG